MLTTMESQLLNISVYTHAYNFSLFLGVKKEKCFTRFNEQQPHFFLVGFSLWYFFPCFRGLKFVFEFDENVSDYTNGKY